VGIADRYNVQSYPTLMQASTKLKQKVLYGYEFDMLDKQINIVANPQAMLLNNAQYIIFDIETTGLVNEFEDIIEFGAIKVKQNEIVDKIDFFIKPSKPLSVQITQLTNITNQHLVDAVGIKTGLKKIID
jgi:DNA polymerase-3 subunit alpha (Gram-positive type)